MRLFTVFKKQVGERKSKQVDWISLKEIQQLELLVEQSYEKPVLIFKHSTRCGISNFVLKKFEESIQVPTDHATFYYLDILLYKNLSDIISKNNGIRHQSPQIIILKDNKVLIHDSHRDILDINFNSYFDTSFRNAA